MSASRPLRDVAAALVGAALALAVVTWVERSGPGRSSLPVVPADDPGELMAWSMQEGGGRPELLALPAGRRLSTCQLPADGVLRPVADATSGLPRRLDHWLAGGPRLYVMELRQGFEAGLPPRVWPATGDPARCPSGRVLVTGETIMNLLYVRSAQEVSDRR